MIREGGGGARLRFLGAGIPKKDKVCGGFERMGIMCLTLDADEQTLNIGETTTDRLVGN